MRVRLRLQLVPAVLRSLVVLLSLGVTCWAAAKKKAFHDDTTILFSGEVVPELKIEIDQAGLEILQANSSNRNNAPNRPNALATVREGTNIFRGVAVHLKGSAGSFRGLDSKPALTLDFDHTFPAQRFHGLKKIHLNNSVQDPTFMCEILGREIFNATTVPAPRAGHATVTLNGERLGLYVLLEGANKQFLKRHFQNVQGNYYEGAFRGDITSYLETKSGAHRDDHSDLDALIAAARESDLERRFAAMARVLDVDRFVSFLALEVLLGHWDGYSLHENNYRIFHNNTSGRLIFMPHGMDQLFGLRRREMDASILPSMSGLAAAAFMETRSGRRLYLNRMAELHTNVFNVSVLTAHVDKLEKLLRPILRSDDDFESRVSFLRSRLAERSEEIGRQLAEMRTPKFDDRGEASLANLSFNVGRRDFFRGGRGRWGTPNGEFSRYSGSPRAILFLEEGRYRLQARIHAEIQGRPVSTNALALTSSAARETRQMKPAGGWIVVQHEFTVSEPDYVELGYQFGALEDLAAFDKSSLKLIRLPSARP